MDGWNDPKVATRPSQPRSALFGVLEGLGINAANVTGDFGVAELGQKVIST